MLAISNDVIVGTKSGIIYILTLSPDEVRMMNLIVLCINIHLLFYRKIWL